MFEINFSNREEMCFETIRCAKEIEGIQKFVQFQNNLYDLTEDWVNFCDEQIDALAYNPEKKELSVRITDSIDKWFVVLDFFDVEIKYFDIAPEHFIDEIFIKQNKDGKYSITFGTGELDFRYSSARLNRFWSEK